MLSPHEYPDVVVTIAHAWGDIEAKKEADGGVIFLDEVGDLHLTAQAMLLRSLQTGEFKPLGATKARNADVRVVSATNRNLNTLVVSNQFRYDLLFRLWYFHLAVPPLRDRGDDWRLQEGEDTLYEQLVRAAPTAPPRPRW